MCKSRNEMKNMVKQYSVTSHFKCFIKLKYFNKNYSFGERSNYENRIILSPSPLIIYKWWHSQVHILKMGGIYHHCNWKSYISHSISRWFQIDMVHVEPEWRKSPWFHAKKKLKYYGKLNRKILTKAPLSTKLNGTKTNPGKEHPCSVLLVALKQQNLEVTSRKENMRDSPDRKLVWGNVSSCPYLLLR